MHDKRRNPYRYVCNCWWRVRSEQEACRTQGTAVSSKRLNSGAILTSGFCQEELVEVLGKGGDRGSVWSGFWLRSEETFLIIWSQEQCLREERTVFSSPGGLSEFWRHPLLHKASVAPTIWNEMAWELSASASISTSASPLLHRSIALYRTVLTAHFYLQSRGKKQSPWYEPPPSPDPLRQRDFNCPLAPTPSETRAIIETRKQGMNSLTKHGTSFLHFLDFQ